MRKSKNQKHRNNSKIKKPSFKRIKNSAAAGEKSPAAAFKIEGHFLRRHLRKMVILSFAKNHHKGEIMGKTHYLREKTRGIYIPILRHHSERVVIVISERWEGICYKSLMRTIFSRLFDI